MESLAEYLSLSELPNSVPPTIAGKQMQGSCDWLTKRSSFRIWLNVVENQAKLGPPDFPPEKVKVAPSCFWLSGKPGVGKSTAAAHVIRHVTAHDFDCSFYFFKSGDTTRSTIAELLRSFAYQLASIDTDLRDAILTAAGDKEVLDKGDRDSIWRTIFLSRILRLEFKRPHYLVIDALDECTNFAVLFPLLRQMCEIIPLRVLITSRVMPSIERYFLHHHISVLAEQVKVEDSLRDIGLFLRINTQLIPIADRDIRNDIISQILRKSNGCFLWVSLVLNALESVHSWRAIQEILNGVPEEMNDLYAQILGRVAAVPYNVTVVKSILRWAICAARPLTIDELEEALYWDINDIVPSLGSAIGTLCGHLVYVDGDSRVQPVHETVRAFFTKECPVDEFAMNTRLEHSRIADICLKYLSQDELDVSRHKPWEIGSSARTFSSFAGYASRYFSHHLGKSTSEADAPLVVLHHFLTIPNVLTWIEILARSGDISPILQTAKDLRFYLGRRAKYLSPLGK